MSLVYGDDSALDARLEKALGDTRLSTTLQASRRHLLNFRAAVEVRHPDWAARVDRAQGHPHLRRGASSGAAGSLRGGDHGTRRPRDPRGHAGRRGARRARDRARAEA